MAIKKIPMRMCVGCKEMKPKKELVRVVRNSEGAVQVDKTGKLPGRGAYICPDNECLQKAKRAKALDRALEHKIEADIYMRLECELSESG